MDVIVKAHDGKVQRAGAREHRGTSGKPRG